MGNCFSGYSSASKDSEHWPADFGPCVTATFHSPQIKVIPPSSLPPPPYDSSAAATLISRKPWSQHFYDVLRQASKEAYFKSVPERHWILFIDDNFRMEPVVRDAVQACAACLLPVFHKTKADAQLYFFSQRNSEYEGPSGEEKEEAALLDQLFRTKNWYEADRLVKGTSAPITKQVEARMKVLKSQTNGFNTLLSDVRDMLKPHWHGWEIVGDDGVDSAKLARLHKEALSKSEQQPKLINSLAFTIQRAVEQIKDRHRTEGGVLPTSFLILTGSALQVSEMSTIQQCMATIRGGSEELGISTLVFVEDIKDSSVSAHQQLDDCNSGSKDIYDAIPFAAPEFLKKGPSKELLGKVFNRHKRSWDRRTLKDAEKYGMVDLLGGSPELQLPSTQEAVQAMRL